MGYSTFQYTFGDGDAYTGNPTSRPDTLKVFDTYPNMIDDQIFNVKMVVSQGICKDSISRSIEVLARPRAEFRPPAPYPGDFSWPTPELQMINQIQPPHPDKLSYQWTWAEAGGAMTPRVFSRNATPEPLAISDWGDFNITQHVTAPNGQCISSVTHRISILAPPVTANFDDVPPSCLPYEVQFRNTSRHAKYFRWSFGDGATSSEENPVHNFMRPGTFDVVLTAQGDHPFPDIRRKTIVVHPTPHAGFDVHQNHVWVGQAVTPTNYTSNRTSTGEEIDMWYLWDWGDGSPNDTIRDPSHMYRRAGTFNITLTVGTYTTPACSTKFTLTEAVTLESAGEIILPNIFKPDVTGEPNDIIPDRGYKNYLFYPPLISPVKKYSMSIFNRWGQLIFHTTDPQRGWNGYFRGRLLDEGVYMYIIEGIYENNQPFTTLGDILLMR